MSPFIYPFIPFCFLSFICYIHVSFPFLLSHVLLVSHSISSSVFFLVFIPDFLSSYVSCIIAYFLFPIFFLVTRSLSLVKNSLINFTLLSSYPLTHVFSLILFPYFLMLPLFLFTHCLLSLTLLFPSLSSCFLSSLFLCTHLISSPLDYFPLLFSHSPCLQFPLTMSSFIEYFLPHFLFNLLFVLFPLFLLPLLLFD